jgi:hypothetical protein
MILSFSKDSALGPAAVLQYLKGYAVRFVYENGVQHEGVIDDVDVLHDTVRMRFFDGIDFNHRGPLMKISDIEEVIYL